MTDDFLPYGRQEISDEDVDAVVAALRSELITQGPTIERFEHALAEYVGARHAVAFANGTAALHGAAFAAGLGPGDEAVVTPMTFAASSNCVLYQGGRVRFTDIDPATWNLDCARAAEGAGSETAAIVVVDFAGLPVDLQPLDPVRERVTVIEDASHAIGARRGGAMVGGAGGADLTTFSFHPVKSMTTGEGGMVTTESDELAERLRLFRTHGITKAGTKPSATEGGWYYEMQELGFNYRITDFQCALGLSQLGRVDGWVTRRNELAARYRELLAGEERIALPPAAADGDRHGHHLFIIRVLESAEKRHEVFERLRERGIGVQVHYIPVYRLPYYRDVLAVPQDECPATEEYYAGAITLPLFPAMHDEDVARVVRELQAALD